MHECGQRVITSGPYAFERHPGYSGALGSLWALLPAAFAGAVLVLRTRWKDALLHSGLEIYADYARGVRFRLAPGIW